MAIGIYFRTAYERIKTNFIDPTLFKGEGVKIVGNLDSFYDAPLFLVHANTEIFSTGNRRIFLYPQKSLKEMTKQENKTILSCFLL